MNRGPVTENEARQAIIDACLQMNTLGINQGKAGNISMRWHRGTSDGYLVTPSGLPYDQTGVDDIVWADLHWTGPRWPAGARREPSSEWRMHQAIYAAHEATAVVHTHSPYATSLACLPRIQQQGIPAFHYMIAVAGGDSIRCAPYALFGTEALARGAMQALAGRRACLLANHGTLCFGDSLESALALAVEVETLARMYWQALQIGEPAVLDAQQMAEVIERFKRYGRARPPADPDADEA